MKKYTVMATETWVYQVMADTEEEAKQKVDDTPFNYKIEMVEMEIIDVEER